MGARGVAVLALTAVFLRPAAADQELSPKQKAQYEENRKRGTAATDEQMDGIPDYGDKQVSKRLRCSACKCLAKELFDELRRVHKLRHGKPRSWEVEEVLEGICATLRNDYGLLRRNNKPTEEFSRNSAISRLTGNWINSYIESRCGELVSSYEDDIVQSYTNGELIDFQRLICSQRDGSCTEEHLLKPMI
eukprot:TRINITY_DN20922_c0_g1_i1.p1 TRINITY_DN20922_c0_g1~~TRINITY_DN20922_c0_g1_i1.p1  ORF type:complete len:215 (+),score=69.73 TRINITY_DN20922_c0_g1_i1:74-646(+)